ncbi:PREDICTED: uncharacterized protein LOC108563969 isoform X2 [Nicrophorus vespilloides]|uniref:Uncharacterized protein LOC108563969 isoform X2 n=1 Tax=Nicrophorus vespilloides TaxID=110193 RepID=A0ABM1MUQ8_NICVS|nr:PREDICTED: uncharacterized protein LOC108563969 isoform X2 [Nicrophorus vespilloides]
MTRSNFDLPYNSADNSNFKMSKVIENASSFEIRSVIKFLNAQNVRPVEISRQVCSVYGENAMSDGMVRKWCRTFNSKKTNVEDDVASTINEDLLDVKRKIIENRITMTELSNNFPQTSRSLLDDVVREHLLFHKVCTRWVASEEYSSVSNPSSSKCAKKDNSEELVVAKSKKDTVYQYNNNRKLKNVTQVVVKLEGNDDDRIDEIPFQLTDGSPTNTKLKIRSNPNGTEEFTNVCLKVECEEQKIKISNLVMTPHDAGNGIPKALRTSAKIKVECEDDGTNAMKNVTRDSCIVAPQRLCLRRIAKSRLPRMYKTRNKQLNDVTKVE